jgi:Microbial-type PARG, catalytic domain
MPGRRLLSDAEVIAANAGFFGDPASVRRRGVLRDTIAALESQDPPDRYHRLAAANLAHWRAERQAPEASCQVQVHAGDWGEVTRHMTARYGVCFAVLNMANAYVPGGAYIEGAIAQEENMFRRTDCHFRIDADQYDVTADRYLPEMTRLLSAHDGVVYLDKDRPRVCIRGPEDRARADMGYRWLSDEQVFPFFELRAAAQDLRDGAAFDPCDARWRIAAQLDTLRNHGLRHAVLSAFGCGAFRNPADLVAAIYRDEIAARAEHFDVIAFAIFAPGYGPDNYTPFARLIGDGK